MWLYNEDVTQLGPAFLTDTLEPEGEVGTHSLMDELELFPPDPRVKRRLVFTRGALHEVVPRAPALLSAPLRTIKGFNVTVGTES